MEIKYQKQEIETHFQAHIYKTRVKEKIHYEILLGAERSEMLITTGKYLRLYDSSNFLNLNGINEWINKQASKLKEKGKKVIVAGNLSYGLARVLDSLPSA